jgi:hypothetical protein
VNEDRLNGTNKSQPYRLTAAKRAAGKRVNEEGDNEG